MSASSRSSSSRRATRTSSIPGTRASRIAVASPIPVDAPRDYGNTHLRNRIRPRRWGELQG